MGSNAKEGEAKKWEGRGEDDMRNWVVMEQLGGRM